MKSKFLTTPYLQMAPCPGIMSHFPSLKQKSGWRSQRLWQGSSSTLRYPGWHLHSASPLQGLTKHSENSLHAWNLQGLASSPKTSNQEIMLGKAKHRSWSTWSSSTKSHCPKDHGDDPFHEALNYTITTKTTKNFRFILRIFPKPFRRIMSQKHLSFRFLSFKTMRNLCFCKPSCLCSFVTAALGNSCRGPLMRCSYNKESIQQCC